MSEVHRRALRAGKRPLLQSSPGKCWGDLSLQASGLVGVSTYILPLLKQGHSTLLLGPCLCLSIIKEVVCNHRALMKEARPEW